jgi:hypothetical protein
LGLEAPKTSQTKSQYFFKIYILKKYKNMKKNIILKERKKLKFENFLGLASQTNTMPTFKKKQKHKKKINLK